MSGLKHQLVSAQEIKRKQFEINPILLSVHLLPTFVHIGVSPFFCGVQDVKGGSSRSTLTKGGGRKKKRKTYTTPPPDDKHEDQAKKNPKRTPMKVMFCLICLVYARFCLALFGFCLSNQSE